MGNGDILEKVERYLRQRQALLGDTLFVAAPPKTEQTPLASPFDGNALETEKSFFPPDALSLGDLAPDAPLAAAAAANGAWRDAPTLDALCKQISGCLRCRLGETRTKFVFGVGNPHADILVIGEAPGADEDAQGEPFVGRAGQLLTKILEAISLRREDVYIANIIKCRPPGNRRPEADETESCEPYLSKQIELIQPKFILALGLTAVNTLLKASFKMGEIRGKQLSFGGIPMIATYHPAALLRNPEWKRAAWDDVRLLRKLYDESLQ